MGLGDSREWMTQSHSWSTIRTLPFSSESSSASLSACPLPVNLSLQPDAALDCPASFSELPPLPVVDHCAYTPVLPSWSGPHGRSLVSL